MAWIEPKTDWVSTDYFNAEDYNRIKNNIGYLKSLTDKLFRGFNWALGYNLIPYPYDETIKTEAGIDYVVNGDGTISANGTSTSNAYFNIQKRTDTSTPFFLPKGTYTSTGCPSGGSITTYSMNIGKSNADTGAYVNLGTDIGSGTTFTITEDSETTQIQIVVKSGTTVENLTFKPMLVRGSEPMEFHPYYETMPNATSDLIVVDKDKNYLSLIYAREINNIETNLETINSNTYGFNIGEKTIYKDNGKVPLYTEYNRIESAILKLYETLTVHKANLPRLAFTLNGEKGIRV